MCHFQWQSKAAQLESSLNEVHTAQLTDQQRLVTITKVFSEKMTALDADVKGAKTVLSLLLNGSVSTTRKLREMQGRLIMKYEPRCKKTCHSMFPTRYDTKHKRR